MPIRPDLRHFYVGPKWAGTRSRILDRAKNKCESCGKPNHRHVWVINLVRGTFTRAGGPQCWSPVKGDGARWRWCDLDGAVSKIRLTGRQWNLARRIRVVLTIAHLNHVAGDDRDENLRALCQWCHLHYDRVHHAMTRQARKDAARPILQEIQ